MNSPLLKMPLPLGNVAGYRHNCTTDLIRKTVEFSARKTVCELIDELHQIHCFLPHPEIFEMLGHKKPGVLATGYWVTGNYSTVCLAVYPSRAMTVYFTSLPFWSLTLSGPPSGATTSTFSLR